MVALSLRIFDPEQAFRADGTRTLRATGDVAETKHVTLLHENELLCSFERQQTLLSRRAKIDGPMGIKK